MGITRTFIIRHLDQEAWFALRTEAMRRRVLTGILLGQIIREWLASQTTNAENVA